jgi:hypothetical protein
MQRDNVILTLATGPHIERFRQEEGLVNEPLLDLARTVVDTARAGKLSYEEIYWEPQRAIDATRALWREVDKAVRGGNVATEEAQP